MAELTGSVLQGPVLCLCGPTAVGKSQVALLVAEKLGGEIVSVDSMQVYRGMDIGTAKPSAAERARVPHHLIDVADLSDSFDAAKFAALARPAIAQIRSRGRLPVLCGGTGLYFKVLLDGLGSAPPVDAALRAGLEKTPLPDLLDELARQDPQTFAQIDRRNPRRVIRAIEVIRLTGVPFSAQRADWKSAPGHIPAGAGLFGLARGGVDLRRRIERRVEEMFERGLVAETKQLLERGLAGNRTALQALGYRQVLKHLQGVRSLPDTIELVKIRTRQFAKRQMTWFRRQLPLKWIYVEQDQTADQVADKIAEVYSLKEPAAGKNP